MASARVSRSLAAVVALAIAVALAVTGCYESSAEDSADNSEAHLSTLVAASEKEPTIPLPKGDPPKDLVVKDLREGEGQVARKGDLVVTKLVAEYVTGKFLESSWKDGPFIFHLGKEEANPGWEKGIPGMRVGGRRLLIVPPDEGSRFGTVGNGEPDDTLVYLVELEAVLPPELENRKEPRLTPPKQPPPAELEVRDLEEGTGPAAEDGDLLTVEYVGIYYDGRHFTNSWKRKKPFQFQLGANEVMINPGWEKGLQGMRVGGRRELVVPPKLQYRGETPAGLKPEDSLIYVIDLIGITEPSAKDAGA
jgi:peptidylprolyl isomerase